MFASSSGRPKLAHSSPTGAGSDSVRLSTSSKGNSALGGAKKSAAKNYFEKINDQKRRQINKDNFMMNALTD